MTDIYDLKQLSDDSWQAKYHGNYGNYNIKLTLDAQFKVKNYSCSCPSEYSPCKHIGFVRDEIKEKVLKHDVKTNKNQITVADVLENVGFDELRNFIIDKAKFNSDLTNDIMLRFVSKTTFKSGENIYSQIIADMLNAIDCDDEDYNEYGEIDIDLSLFKEWLEKAKDAVKKDNLKEAEFICKACIEEYAKWSNNLDYEIDSFAYEDYQNNFFEVLEEMTSCGQLDKKLLYNYCKDEISKKQYSNSSAKNYFNNLMAILAIDIDPEDFISSQLNLIKNISNTSSDEAKIIFNRLINFYNSNNQPEKAEMLVEHNLQIDDFRIKVINKHIANAQFNDAKKLILERLKNSNDWNNTQWKVLLLTIAQKENDIPSIRKISFEFIENRFDENYFTIYKKTFSTEEWSAVFEKLYKVYIKPLSNWDRGFKNNAANLLKAEKSTKRLLEYIENYATIHDLERYYITLHIVFPERILLQFKRSLNDYLDKNVGRNHYEYANDILKKMRKIDGGSKEVALMVQNYRVIYKNRRAMMEILNKL